MTTEIHLDRRTRRGRQVWRLWWRDEAGKKRTLERRVWTRKEVQAEAERMDRELNRRGLTTPWAEFAAKYAADQTRRNQPLTVADVRSVLRRFEVVVHPTTLESVTRETVAAYLAGLGAAGARPATHNKHLRTLRAAFQWAIDAGIFYTPDGERMAERNPCQALKRLKETHLMHVVYQDRAACRRLADELAKDGPAWAAAAMFGMECGLRLSEISHLAWRSVDLGRGEVVIQPEPDGWRPKGRSGRMFFGPQLTARLAAMRRTAESAGRGAPEARVFGGDSPGRFEREFRRRLKEACGRAGLPAILPHGLRRTFATILANEGMEATQLRTVMRHNDIQTTMTFYVEINERKAAAAGLERLRRADGPENEVPNQCPRVEGDKAGEGGK